jgi:hypothetical protein
MTDHGRDDKPFAAISLAMPSRPRDGLFLLCSAGWPGPAWFRTELHLAFAHTGSRFSAGLAFCVPSMGPVHEALSRRSGADSRGRLARTFPRFSRLSCRRAFGRGRHQGGQYLSLGAGAPVAGAGWVAAPFQVLRRCPALQQWLGGRARDRLVRCGHQPGAIGTSARPLRRGLFVQSSGTFLTLVTFAYVRGSSERAQVSWPSRIAERTGLSQAATKV